MKKKGKCPLCQNYLYICIADQGKSSQDSESMNDIPDKLRILLFYRTDKNDNLAAVTPHSQRHAITARERKLVSYDDMDWEQTGLKPLPSQNET